ncbi:M56 family metallopeptidase [Flavobacterium sp.]|uniref:M56 family metallopeptidase n=1 Tax=Flavobacterium sp. TaxID=239 RepID=UPI00260BB724|nr:M56 family metallopeptidase [Flavobacterium sp.]
MTAYIIKSAISLLVLLVLYHLALEREKMHRFNRFYLLFALAFSALLPFITIPVYIEAEVIPVSFQDTGTTAATAAPQVQPKESMLPLLITIAYLSVTLALFIRFAFNINSFLKKIRLNTKIPFGAAKLVLLDERVLPHTFLNYIFVSREEYENGLIEEELYTHELTHVRQRHTLDILFIELLKTIFWFNPLFYLYGRSIRLNHEFLADEQVVHTTSNAAYYQNLLVQKASGATLALASNLNFSITKKRLLMMTKSTNKTKAAMLKIGIAPVIALMLGFMCTEEVIAQQKLADIPSKQVRSIEVNSITQQQHDSIKKANPGKYNGSYKEFGIVTVKYTDDNNRPVTIKDVVKKDATAKQQPSEVFINEIKGIAPERIRKIENSMVSDNEMEQLKQDHQGIADWDPDAKYRKLTVTYVDENGNEATKVDYIKEKPGVNPTSINGDITSKMGNEDNLIYKGNEVTIQPKFKENGMAGFYEFVNKNLVLPKLPDGTHRVYVSFVVEVNGSVSDVKILRSPNEELSTNIISIINETSGKWIPGEVKDEPVRVSYNLPISINIKN